MSASRFDLDSDYHPEIYARTMMTLRHGYPPFRPEPTDDERAPNEAYVKIGLEPGDVILLNDDGGYHFVFNCALPRDHPKNMRGVPEPYKPFLFIDVNYSSGSYFSAGTRLRSTSGGVKRDKGLKASGKFEYVFLLIHRMYIEL
jgi:hypothetical protein